MSRATSIEGVLFGHQKTGIIEPHQYRSIGDTRNTARLWYMRVIYYPLSWCDKGTYGRRGDNQNNWTKIGGFAKRR